MSSQAGKLGVLAHVKHVRLDGKCYLELRDGQILPYNPGDCDELTVGDVVLISVDSSRVDKAPAELWHEEPWVGVIKLVTADRLVVDINGRFRVITRPADLSVQQGNTVAGTDTAGITEILCPKPVRLIEFPEIDDSTVAQYKHPRRNEPTFDDFGGYDEAVARARELIEVPLEKHSELTKIGARPIKGVLLTGPPGTGKTLLARIIANQANAQFYEISGPEIISKWYGQSAELIRKIFEDAANQPRAIIFFDEIDSIAVRREADTHEESRRIVGQLLTAIDGFKRVTNVIVVAATNRPADVDRALRRPGRFDWQINFPMPTRKDREEILAVSARRLSKGEELPYSLIADRTESWTPADLSAIWSEAALLAAADGREAIFVDDFIGGFDRVSRLRTRLLAEECKPGKPGKEDAAQ